MPAIHDARQPRETSPSPDDAPAHARLPQAQPAVMALHASDREAQVQGRWALAVQRGQLEIGPPRNMPRGQAVEKIRLRRRGRKITAALRMRRLKETVADARKNAAEVVPCFAHRAQQRFDRRAVLVVELLVRFTILRRLDLRPRRARERRVALKRSNSRTVMKFVRFRQRLASAG